MLYMKSFLCPVCMYMYIYIYTCYTERLKSTNCMELCQVSLGRRWIRKSNKLTKNQGNPNGTPRYDKLYFGKFCCVKDEETHCGRNYQTIVKVALNFTKNKQIILERWWFTTCRCQMKVITTQAAFTFSSLLRQTPTKPRKACEIWNSVGMLFEVSNDVRTTSERRIERRQRASKPRPQSIILSVSFHYPFSLFHFLSFVFSHFFRIDSKHKKHHEPEHHVIMNAW